MSSQTWHEHSVYIAYATTILWDFSGGNTHIEYTAHHNIVYYIQGCCVRYLDVIWCRDALAIVPWTFGVHHVCCICSAWFHEICRMETRSLSAQWGVMLSTTCRDAVWAVWVWFGAETPWQSCHEHSVYVGCAVYYAVNDFMRFVGWKQTHLAHIVSEHHLLHTGMLCELSGCDLVQRCLGNRAMNIR